MGVDFSWNPSTIVLSHSGRNNPFSGLFTSFQHRPLQPLVVPFLNLRKPGHLSELPLHCQGAAVDPLQRVHVRVQHLANLMDRVPRVLSSSSRIEVLDNLFEVPTHACQLTIET